MAFTLVYTGEHFVIDIFMGWLYAFCAWYFGSKLLDRWEARKLRRQLAVGPASLSELGTATITN